MQDKFEEKNFNKYYCKYRFLLFISLSCVFLMLLLTFLYGKSRHANILIFYLIYNISFLFLIIAQIYFLIKSFHTLRPVFLGKSGIAMRSLLGKVTYIPWTEVDRIEVTRVRVMKTGRPRDFMYVIARDGRKIKTNDHLRRYRQFIDDFNEIIAPYSFKIIYKDFYASMARGIYKMDDKNCTITYADKIDFIISDIPM